MGDKYYALEKFGSAVRYLAVHDGTRRDLLREARSIISPISEKDLPHEAIPAFQTIQRRLTFAEDTTSEGIVVASLRKMSDQEAVTIAGLIVDVHGDLQRWATECQKNGERVGTHHPDTQIES